ncbi:GDSL family lipase [Segniliparus rotundus DSM 44985]|uniref:GDSL family lipase n=2 Tax=Segniliparus rotundus TaxID=286802 RepID=D6Z9B1_SEGRD|nr:GDSL family lipase [Segniliparus rotundus DSM 44985]
MLCMSPRWRAAARLTAVSFVCALASPVALADSAPGGKHAHARKYVALGDSFAAAPFQDPVDPSSGGCERSLNNYPSQVADSLGLERDSGFVDATCSGATSYGITEDEGPQGVAGGHSAMLDAVDADADLVTVTIGAANDGLAQTVFSDCDLGGGDCEQKVRAKPQLGDMSGFFPELKESLADALRQIRQAAPKATVLVVSYLRAGIAWCPAWGSYNAQDAMYIDGLEARLNNALKEAAVASRSTFVDVNPVSSDHGVCADDPWVAGGGASLGGDIALHPSPAGQTAAARAVLAALKR